MAVEVPDVRSGQVWADNDKRERQGARGEGRTIEVLEVKDLGGGPYATVRVLTDRYGAELSKPRETRIAVRRFRPNSTGYRLIKDVAK